jgi:diguanylate cyclase (GGDEF)-like protein
MNSPSTRQDPPRRALKLKAHVLRLIARCRAARKPIAVLMIDVDHFKRINDEHGHAAGDRVLMEIIDRVTSDVRPSDLVARMGGEEFAVVMPETDLDAALRIAERLRSRPGVKPRQRRTRRTTSELSSPRIRRALPWHLTSNPMRPRS